MKYKNAITQEELMNAVEYDADSGVFTWLNPHPRQRKRIGHRAGTLRNDGYRGIGVCGSLYMEHRLAWLYVYGRWPKGGLDHINRDKADNRICNLRECSQGQNNHNRAVQSNNKIGLKGVTRLKGERKYRSVIGHDGKYTILGWFDTPEEAHEAHKMKSIELYGEFSPYYEKVSEDV